MSNSLLLIAPTVISVILVFAIRSISPEFWQSIIQRLAQDYRAAIWLLVLAVFAAIVLCVWALRAFPNSGDEYVYLFQADTFLAGRLWNDLDPLHQHFSFFHIFEKDGKWVGMYAPGWPLVLAAAQFIAIPSYLVSPIVAVLLVLVAARLYRFVVGPFGAVAGTALLAFNAFFLLNAASYFPHIATALFATIFVLHGLRYLDNPTIGSSLIVGSAIGAVGITRPYSAVLLTAPFAVELVLRQRYRLKMITWIIVAVLPFFAGLLLYNWAITGNPFLLVEQWGYPLFRLGLHSHDALDELGDQSNLLDTSEMTLKRLLELAEWTSPFLILLYLFAGYSKIKSLTFRFYDFIFPVFLAGYLMFPSMGGNRYGPRFYLEAYPFLVLTIISAVIPPLTSKLDETKAGFLRIMLGSLVFSGLMIPMHVYEQHQIVNERMQPYDAVRNAKLSHAVAILLTGSGSIRPMDAMDLTRNGIKIRDADIIYALGRSDPRWLYATGQDPNSDLKLTDLFEAFPGRNFYVFEQSGAAGQATLRKLER